MQVGVGIQMESKWLERLALLVDNTGAMGRFIYSASVGAVVGSSSAAAAAAHAVPLPQHHRGHSGGSAGIVTDEDPEVEFISVVPRKVSVIDLSKSQTSITASSLSEAFGSISSQLTSTLTLTMQSQGKNGGGGRIGAAPKQQRLVRMEAPEEWMDDETGGDEMTYKAHKMELNLRRHIPAFEAEPLERDVRLRNRPFSRGAERNAYHMHDETEQAVVANEYEAVHYVAKESRLQEHFNDRLKFHMVSSSFPPSC